MSREDLVDEMMAVYEKMRETMTQKQASNLMLLVVVGMAKQNLTRREVFDAVYVALGEFQNKNQNN